MSETRIESWEAIRKATKGISSRIAKRLKLHPDLIRKWGRPCENWNDTGAINPLDRLEELIKEALDSGKKTKEQALAPLHWLADQFNMIVSKRPEQEAGIKGVLQELTTVISSFGRFTETTSGAIADSKLEPREIKAIKEKINALHRELSSFEKIIESSAGNID